MPAGRERGGSGVRAASRLHGAASGCAARPARRGGPGAGVLFDCDGVLWNGEVRSAGRPRAAGETGSGWQGGALREQRWQLARGELALRFARLGFGGCAPVALQLRAAPRALRQRLLGPPDTQGAVFVLGGEGLRAELRAAGLPPGRETQRGPESLARACAPIAAGYGEHFSFAKLSGPPRTKTPTTCWWPPTATRGTRSATAAGPH